MAEPLKGRQSKLRNMQRPPDSDTIFPEPQLETAAESDYGGDDGELSAEDLALMEKLFVKKPAESTGKPSQAPATPLQTGALARPASARTEELKIFTRQAFAKAPSRKNEPAVKPPVHPDIAIPTVEAVPGANTHQDAHTTSVPSSWLQMPTLGERVTETPPTTVEATQDTGKDPYRPEDPAPVETAHAGLVQLEQPSDLTEPKITVQPKMQGAPPLKKKRSGTKGGKIKKRASFAPLSPLPPRPGPSSGLSTTQVLGTLFTKDTAVEGKPGADRPQRLGEDFAVKYQPGETTCIDGPLEAAQATSAAPIDATNASPAAHNHRIEPSAQTDQTSFVQPSVGHQANEQQPLRIPDVCTDRQDLPTSTRFGIHDQHLQAQQDPVVELQAPRGHFPGPAPTAARCNGRFRPCSNFKPLPAHHASSSAQHMLSDTGVSNLAPVNPAHPHAERTQDVLHGVSSRAGSVRVTKSSKQTHVPQDARAAASVRQHTHAMSTALDVALDALRNACLADQDRLEDQLAVREKAWERERSSLQTTITKQLETIAEQRVKLELSEKRVAELAAELARKLKSSQKFVAGLQRDHEKLQQSTVDIHEQSRKALQVQIAQVVKEKEDLQAGLETMIASCEKSQKNMLKTMHEIQLRYVTTLSRENDLKIRLNERMTMYEEEMHRRAELEQQLLPSVQTMQGQLSESFATLVEKISSLQASMETQTAESSRDSIVKECLLILQQFQSLPLLTSKDVRKAEGMLRYLYKKTDAGFKLIARDPEDSPISIEDIRDCIRDQMQGLQANIVRNDQAVADGQLAREANERLATDMDTEKQKNQRLEEQAVSLRHSEATLKSRITLLEQERDGLRDVVEAHQAEPRKFEQKIEELETQLSTISQDLRKSNAVVQEHERQRLKEELNFAKYRADALVHLDNLRKRIWQITDEGKAKARECCALNQDVAEVRAQLDSEQTKTNQLTAAISRYEGDMEIMKQEKNDAIEKEGRTRESLQSVEDLNRELQTENHKLSTEIEEVHRDLIALQSAEQKLTSQCTGLQKQVSALQDAKCTSDKHLRQVQYDSQLQLQQAQTDYTASLDDLKSSLKLSEDARKELQAKLRQEQAGHHEQIEHHQQTFNAKFEDLAAQSQQEQDKLKAKHRQEMEECEQNAETRIADTKREAERLIKEADIRRAEAVETERRLEEAEISAAKILVPNTQQSEHNGAPSSQQSHSGRSRKKVDRQTNSVTVVVSSSHRSLGSAQGHSILDRAAIPDRRREGPENQFGYFEQEYASRFGSQALSQDQEMQPSILDPEAETVPETQDFEYGQGVTAQFEIIESQVMASDNADSENLTDLSTMSSEDLSEMLMDIHPRSQQHRRTPKQASSPDGELRTPRQSAQDKTPDAHLTNSQDWPKSRANTASRLMPLPQQDGQRQRMQADQGHGQVSHTRAERNFRDDNNDSPDCMYPNNVVSKRTYGHRSGHDADSGQKRKAPGSVDDSGSFKKLRTSAQAFAQRPSSISKSYAPYTPPPTNAPAQDNSSPSPARMTSRRSSYRQSSRAGSRGAVPRLSSTRNTRSKGNRYSERFEDEFGRR